jgi:hypothetical protein
MPGLRRPTPDDVTILWDGRRLDSREAVMEWLADVEEKRAEEATDGVVRRGRANLDRLVGALRELHARLRVGGMSDAEAQMLPVQIDGTALDMAGCRRG